MKKLRNFLLHVHAAGVLWLDLTPASWRLVAPLTVGLALSCGGSFQGVTFVAGEVHHIIVVEAIACGAAIDRATRVAACDSLS